MKLKYNLIAWSLLGFFAAACDPMDDIYNEIDAEGTTNTQTMAEYVLTDADYETISSAAAKAATSDAEKALANAVKTDKALNEIVSRNLKEQKTFCTFTCQKKAARDILFAAPLYSRGSSPRLIMSIQLMRM